MRSLTPDDAGSIGGVPGPIERELLDLGFAAKLMCSGLYVSERSEAALLERVVAPHTSAGTPIEFQVNQELRRVSAATASGLVRHALYCGDQGAVLLPVGASKVFFEPRPISSSLPPAALQDWPLGDRSALADAQTLRALGYDLAQLKRSEATVMAPPPAGYTSAWLVCHRGRLISECYAPQVQAQTQLQSWSMGKTLVASLVGRFVQRGELDLDQRALLPQWCHGSDPRQEIRLRDLLQMSSGLDFTAPWKEDYEPAQGFPDHSYMYSGSVDVEQLALSRSLNHEPGTFGAYQNADTLALLAICKRLGAVHGLHPLELPQRLLLDAIGIRHCTLETDCYGNQVLTGYNFGTARDWVRVGLLWLHRGRWQGSELMPEAFVDFACAPAPAWRGKYWMAQAPEGFDDSIYGAQLFRNHHAPEDRWPLPEDACFMLGIAGQVTFFVPSLELVIVRFADYRALEHNTGREPLQQAIAELLPALPAS
ncbi:MAG: serine hydrolase [Pseudomonadota bacterium]